MYIRNYMCKHISILCNALYVYYNSHATLELIHMLSQVHYNIFWLKSMHCKRQSYNYARCMVGRIHYCMHSRNVHACSVRLDDQIEQCIIVSSAANCTSNRMHLCSVHVFMTACIKRACGELVVCIKMPAHIIDRSGVG